MNIGIIAAGAGIGLHAVKQAVEKGHMVTALSTNTDQLATHPNFIKIKGSATVSEDLKNTIKNTDAVLITVGTKNKKATTLFSDVAKALISVTADMNFSSPVLVITGFGAGESKGYLSFFMHTVISLFLNDQYNNKTIMEDLITGSAIKWEIVRPGMLTDGELTSSYRVLPNLKKGMKVRKISRADVAQFLITEAENPKMLHHYVALTN
ncbi:MULTISPECIES: NAD(P)-dependent oxidoreductase [unclassified Sphingobacterium]|uniref:NAD(P)-dependent oxidoreductase n=1 Tax=unclassified Sphingobacterium TaxID=2609468 RepID=UPI001049187F|nr:MULTISPECIES: NAD(P)H-binding protein [unclassified Sphingobacterium]MCS3552389.1 putative NADH-flavin reductase [Sphingobacterium sp. JUb21]TCR10848.1 putative NADH-flavin reductase [Sphingobacterium sp. JUb20]